MNVWLSSLYACKIALVGFASCTGLTPSRLLKEVSEELKMIISTPVAPETGEQEMLLLERGTREGEAYTLVASMAAKVTAENIFEDEDVKAKRQVQRNERESNGHKMHS